MTRNPIHALETLGRLFFDRLAGPGSGLLRSACRALLSVHPGLHGLYLYRTGRLHEALNCFARTGDQTLWSPRIRHRVSDMVRVLEYGWVLPEAVSRRARRRTGTLMALHNSLPLDATGYALRSQELLRHLRARGERVLACTRPGYPRDIEKHRYAAAAPQDTVDGVTYVRLQAGGMNIGAVETAYVDAYAWALETLAKREQVALIHGVSQYLTGLAAVTAARRLGVPSIYEIRGLWHLTRAFREPGYERTDHFSYCRLCEWTAARSADAVITLSGPLKRTLVEEGIPEERIHVIPNAVDTNQFQPGEPDAELIRELGIRGRTVVGYMGTLTGYEGVDLILRAVADLAAQNVPVTALIVGEGYEEARLRALARRLNAPESIRFTGFVPHDQVRRYYSVMDILPFPRRDVEVCRLVPPLKILEGMAMGKALVISDLPALREMVTHGETGLVCAPDRVQSLRDCLSRLIADPGMRGALSENARRWVAAHRDWSPVAERVAALYRQLTGRAEP